MWTGPLSKKASSGLVAVTVVSDAVPGQVVIDAGSKTLTSDGHHDGGNGLIVGVPDARLRALNEEHGYVDVSALQERPAVGPDAGKGLSQIPLYRDLRILKRRFDHDPKLLEYGPDVDTSGGGLRRLPQFQVLIRGFHDVL